MSDTLSIVTKIAHDMLEIPLKYINENSTLDSLLTFTSLSENSLRRFEFLLATEIHFDIEVSTDEISNCKTIRDLCDLIDTKKAK